MKFWLEKKRERRPGKSLLRLRPVDWGPGTEKSSTEIDEVLYG